MANRAVAATSFNAVSTRSHVLFRLHVSATKPGDAPRQAVLDFVDLAGSERYDMKPETAAARVAETLKINLSLATLTTVIRELARASSHVRFRDSTLTHLLQASLSGGSKVVLIATVSPSPSDKDETISTLRFASEAANVSIPKSK